MSIMETGKEFYAPILCVFKYAAHQLGEICYLGQLFYLGYWCLRLSVSSNDDHPQSRRNRKSILRKNYAL